MSDNDVITVILRFFTRYESEDVPIEVDWGGKRVRSKQIEASPNLTATGLKIWLIQEGVIDQDERVRCDLQGSLKIKDRDIVRVILPGRPISVKDR